MGTIVQFPDTLRISRDNRPVSLGENATVIILPSIRVERHPDRPRGDSDPTTTDTPPRRGRRGNR
jgi:hypothetical protein